MYKSISVEFERWSHTIMLQIGQEIALFSNDIFRKQKSPHSVSFLLHYCNIHRKNRLYIV